MAESLSTGALLERAPVDLNVVVGRFDYDNFKKAQNPSDPIEALLPLLENCKPPMKMTVSVPDAKDRNGMKTLKLQDSSGKQSYQGVVEKLESNYIVLTEEPGAQENGKPVYSILPVTEWVTFHASASQAVTELSIEEQNELFESLQEQGQRPTRATLAFRDYLEKKAGIKRDQDEADIGGLESMDGTEYSSLSKSRRTGSKRGGQKSSSAARLDNLDAIYEQIEANDEDEFGDLGRTFSTRGGQAYDEDAVNDATYTKSYDVTGLEGGAEEGAADIEVDYFADDAGDDGRFEDLGDVEGLTDQLFEGDDIGALYAADNADAEDDEIDLLLEDENLDPEQLAQKAVEAAAQPAAVLSQETTTAKKQKQVSAPAVGLGGSGAPAASAEGIATIKEELISLFKASGYELSHSIIVQRFQEKISKPHLKENVFRVLKEISIPRSTPNEGLRFALIPKYR